MATSAVPMRCRMRDLIYGELILNENGRFSSFPFASEQSENIDSFAFEDRLRVQVQREPRRADQGVRIAIDQDAHLAA